MGKIIEKTRARQERAFQRQSDRLRFEAYLRYADSETERIKIESEARRNFWDAMHVATTQPWWRFRC